MSHIQSASEMFGPVGDVQGCILVSFEMYWGLVLADLDSQRFTGPQILRFRSRHPVEYSKTSRISLVSSFLASIFLGKIAPIDKADVCGMNLFDIKTGSYNQKLMALAAGSPITSDLESKLGHVTEDGGINLGKISPYFVRR